MGSPPRMRGKVFPPYSPAWKYRITPAYAGKSSLPFPPRKCCRDHPRVCGEKRARKTSTARWQGSPPRMRGKVEIQLPTGHSRGITPAYAGKSWTRQTKQFVSWDHPRVCGEKRTQAHPAKTGLGSPPRMRGKETPDQGIDQEFGITPAYAGKRECPTEGAPAAGDHPRVCGEK